MEYKKLSFDPLNLFLITFLYILVSVSIVLLIVFDEFPDMVVSILVVFICILTFFYLLFIMLHFKIIIMKKEGIIIKYLFRKNRFYAWSSLNILYNGAEMIIMMRAFTMQIEFNTNDCIYVFCKRAFFEKVKRINW